MKGQIAQRQVCEIGVQVTVIGRQLHRRSDLVADDVDRVEVMRQADEICIIRQVAGAPPVDPVADIGRPGHQTEAQVVAAESQTLFRRPRGQGEGGRRCLDRVDDEIFVHAHDRAVTIHRCAGSLEEVQYPVADHPDAELGQNAHGGVVQRLHLFRVQQFDRRVGVLQFPPGKLWDPRDGAGGFSTAAAVASVPRHGL